MHPRALLTLLPLLTVLGAAPAWAGTDETPGGSSALGFPIALVLLAVVATAYALFVRRKNQKKDHDHH